MCVRVCVFMLTFVELGRYHRLCFRCNDIGAKNRERARARWKILNYLKRRIDREKWGIASLLKCGYVCVYMCRMCVR